MVFLPLHTPVLKPDLYLSFRQAKSVGDFHPAPASKIAVVVELFLQLKNLLSRVSCAWALGFSPRIVRAHCGKTEPHVNKSHTIFYIRHAAEAHLLSCMRRPRRRYALYRLHACNLNLYSFLSFIMHKKHIVNHCCNINPAECLHRQKN